MAGMTLAQQTEREKDLWTRLYERRQSVSMIAAEIGQSPQSIYAFMARRRWPLSAPEAKDRPPRP